jgi:hypothetical protein
MSTRYASLSLDLDNKWSYLQTHGDAGWGSFPSYLDLVVPRVLDFLHERNLRITFFVVGQDAALETNRAALASLSAAGHEIGNHSFQHEPWLHLYSASQLVEEFDRAEQHIEHATGQRPLGFRGPGFSCSDAVLSLLAERGYEYDCSSFPTFLGPLARAYYFMTANLSDEQKSERKQLFGKFSEGFRTLRPHPLATARGELIEIPVTTMPIFKVPIHLSYVLYLGQYSKTLAKAYVQFSLSMCRTCRVEPSILLHPLDFMGADDDSDLGFFPAMQVPAAEKLELAAYMIDALCRKFEVVTMRQHAQHVRQRLSRSAASVDAATT